MKESDMNGIDFDSEESKKFYIRLMELEIDVKELLVTIPLNNNENLETLSVLSRVGRQVRNSLGIMWYTGQHENLPIRDGKTKEEESCGEGLLEVLKYYAGRKNTAYSRS